MHSPSGWSEPGQCPEFDEFTVVIEGEVVVDSENGSITVPPEQSVMGTSGAVGAVLDAQGGWRYVAVCVPAFSPAAVHRDDEVDGFGS